MNTETQNYKIIVAYDGTRYKGWQVQKSTDDTIQGKLQHVLSTLAGKPVQGARMRECMRWGRWQAFTCRSIFPRMRYLYG